MAVIQIISQFKDHTRLDPAHIVAREAKLQRERVRRSEGRAKLRVGQGVGIVVDALERAFAIDAVKANGDLRRNVVSRQELDQAADTRLFSEGSAHFQRFFPGDAGDLAQALRLRLQNFQAVRAEALYDPLRRFRADPSHRAARKIRADLRARIRQKPL